MCNALPEQITVIQAAKSKLIRFVPHPESVSPEFIYCTFALLSV